MAWLTGWDQRIKLTIDYTKVDAGLTWFPVTVFLDPTHGDCVFDELTSDANRFKIAFTKADGETELYGEIEKWDDANELAIIHVSKDGWAISGSGDTDFYMYYDVDHADNTTYIGDINSTPGAAVWDGDFLCVLHMSQDPAIGGACILDSTSNSYDGTPGGMDASNLVAGLNSYGLNFEYGDYVKVPYNATMDANEITVEAFTQPSALANRYMLFSRWNEAVGEYPVACS